MLYEVCAPGLILVSGLEESFVDLVDTLGTSEGALAAAHTIKQLLWALVDRLVKKSLAIATNAFVVDEVTQLWVLDLEAGDPHAEGDFDGLVLRIDAVPLANTDGGPAVARLVLHDLVDADEAAFEDGLDGLIRRLFWMVRLGVEEGLGLGPVCGKEFTEVVEFGAGLFGVSEGELQDVLELVLRLGAGGGHGLDEAHGGGRWKRVGDGGWGRRHGERTVRRSAIALL